MNETLSLSQAQPDWVEENRSGGVDLNSANGANVGGDVVGRDKVESAGGHIIHAESGSTVVVNEPFRPPRAFWTAWRQRMVPLIGLVVMLSAAGLLLRLNRGTTSEPADMVYVPAGSFTMGSDLP